MIFLFIFLASLNFFGLSYIFTYLAVFFVFLETKWKMCINGSFIMLLFFAVFVFTINFQSLTGIVEKLRPFEYALYYVIGLSVFRYKSNEVTSLAQAEKQVSSIIYTVSAGTILHFMLNMVINLGTDNRNDMVDIWSNRILAATGLAVLACFAVCISTTFLLTDVDIRKKAMGLAILILIIMYNLMLAGRTLFVLYGFAFFVGFVFLAIDQKRIPKVFYISLVLAPILCLLYSQNVFDIKTTWESSNFYNRFYGGEYTQDISEDKRLTHKLEYVSHLLEYPWGGSNIRRSYGHSAHDLYLDTYDESGVFAFGAIFIYIIFSLKRLWKCIRSKKLGLETRMLILSVYMVCNLEFWMEPIIRGMPWMLSFYCCIDGAVTYLLEQVEKHPATI